MLWTIIWLSLVSVGVWIYIKLKRNSRHWKNRGVLGPEPHLILGNFSDCFLKRSSYADTMKDLYLEYRKHPVFGTFNLTNPILIVNDPTYIERILKTDFRFFTDRVPSHYANRHEMYRNLFNLNGPQWKAMRNKMAPVFTSLKMRFMTPEMEKCFENARVYIDERLAEGSMSVDAVEVASIFSHDVIVQCLFGIESRELSKPGAQFRRMQTQFFDMSLTKMLYFSFIDMFPGVADFFNLTHFSGKTVDYFQKLVEATMNQRTSRRNERPDLVQVLLKMREKKVLDIYDWDRTDSDRNDQKTLPLVHPAPIQTVQVTDELLESQAMIFFHTGVDALVAGLSFAIHELANCPEALARLRQEIDSTVDQNGLTPKALKAMTYLDMCVKETLRLYPVVPAIIRLCGRRYELPCGLVLEQGDYVSVPITGLHMDPDIFPDPESFAPERFLQEPPPFTYLPFGEGPRICFAIKFVMTEIKIGLCKLIQHYDIGSTSNRRRPVDLAKWCFFLKSTSPLYLNIRRRNFKPTTDN